MIKENILIYKNIISEASNRWIWFEVRVSEPHKQRWQRHRSLKFNNGFFPHISINSPLDRS